MGEIMFQLSGDPEEDARTAARLRKAEAMKDEGMCPNGCAPVVWDNPYVEHCPVCGFIGGHNVPYAGRPKLYGKAAPQ